MNLAIDSWDRQVDKYGTLTPVWVGDKGHLNYEINVMMGEIDRVISYYRSLINHSEAEIDMIILTGDYPYLDDIANQMQQSIGKEPYMFTQDLFDTQSKELIPPRYYLPLGLSLKGGV